MTPNNNLLPKIWQIYKHYKHTSWNKYIYEVINIVKHTETSENLVIYKALYDTDDDVYVFARPLSMWFENILYNQKMTCRFTLIVDDILR